MSEVKVLKKLNVLVRGDSPYLPNMDNLNYRQAAVNAGGNAIYDRIIARETILMVNDPEEMMDRLYEISKPGCQLIIDVPFGSHDRAEEWQFKRKVFADTLRQFEPNWRFVRRTFYLDSFFFNNPGVDIEQLGMAVANLRNVCKGIACELVAQKPVPEDYKASDPVSSFKLI